MAGALDPFWVRVTGARGPRWALASPRAPSHLRPGFRQRKGPSWAGEGPGHPSPGDGACKEGAVRGRIRRACWIRLISGSSRSILRITGSSSGTSGSLLLGRAKSPGLEALSSEMGRTDGPNGPRPVRLTDLRRPRPMDAVVRRGGRSTYVSTGRGVARRGCPFRVCHNGWKPACRRSRPWKPRP
jgi:hypothetical protein